MIKHRTPEWYQARIGKFTASAFPLLMSKPADKTALISKSALNCIEKAACQLFYNKIVESPDSQSTRWGINNELRAIKEFVELYGFQHQEAGFVLHPNIQEAGATPDAIILEPSHANQLIIAQIKCPFNSLYHTDYVNKIHDNKSLFKTKSAYYWQVQGEMWVTGAIHSYFISFDPRRNDKSRIHAVKITRDENAMNQLHEKVNEAIALRNKLVEDYRLGHKRPSPLSFFW